MNDLLVTFAMGTIAVTFGTLMILFREKLRRVMTDLLFSIYGRVGSLAGDRISPTALVLAGSGFIAMGAIAISIGLIKFLFL